MATEAKHPSCACGCTHVNERVELAYSGMLDAEWLFTCRHCQGTNFKSLACPCGVEYYCSSECQDARWKEEHSTRHGSMYPDISKEELQQERRVWRELRDALHEPGAPPTLFDVITKDSRHFRLPWVEAACLLGHHPERSILKDVTLARPVRVAGIIRLDQGRHRYIMRPLHLVPDMKRIREKYPGLERSLESVANSGKPLTVEQENYVYKKGTNRRIRHLLALKSAIEAKEDQDGPKPEPAPEKEKSETKEKEDQGRPDPEPTPDKETTTKKKTSE